MLHLHQVHARISLHILHFHVSSTKTLSSTHSKTCVKEAEWKCEEKSFFFSNSCMQLGAGVRGKIPFGNPFCSR